MGSLHDSVRHAFDAPGWLSSAEAFFHACSLSLFVVDLDACEPLYVMDRCGYCHLSLDAIEPGPLECYDRPPAPTDSLCQQECRAGLATYLAPVRYEGSVVCHAVVSGFVSSTRERRRLYEHLIGRGVREEVARLAVRSMPVVTRREIEALARLASSIAQSAIGLSAAQSGLTASADPSDQVPDPAEASESMSAAESVVGVLEDPVKTSRHLLATALRAFGADAGTLAVTRSGGYVELIASAGEGVRPRGTKLRLEGGAAARALKSGRTVVVRSDRSSPGGRSPCTVVAPLMVGNKASGTLELRLSSGPLPGESDIHRIERFASFAALAIEHSERHSETQDALAASQRANTVGGSLERLTDGAEVVAVVLEELDRSFSFDVAGVVLTGWGRDRAEVVIGNDVTRAEVEMLIEEAAGRDTKVDPLDGIGCLERGGTLLDDPSVREHWAFICTSLSTDNHHSGYLFCASTTGIRYTFTDGRLLEAMAGHAAAAIERAALFSRVRDDFARTIAALSASLATNDRAAEAQPARVVEYATLIGESLSLPREQLDLLRYAGLLHELGTTNVAEQILLSKPDHSDAELERVKAVLGSAVSVVEQIDFLKEVTPAVLHHHERWDGEGYPMGLKGKSIPLLARVLAVADAFGGLTGSRENERCSLEDARRRLQEAAGAQFDPVVVAALLEALDRQETADSTNPVAAGERSDLSGLPA